jgi:hypothetical protein
MMNEPAPGYTGGGPVEAPGGGKAIASLILGLAGLLFWILPILGLPVTIVGLVLGIKATNSARKGMATAGVVLCIIGLVLSVMNAAIGAYLGVTGQLQ